MNHDMIKGMRFFLSVIMIFSAFTLWASPYDIIPAGDPILEDIRFLSSEAGKPFLAFTPPLAPHEIGLYLDSLDASLLSEPAQEAYRRIESRLTPQPNIQISTDNFMFSLGINSTLEGRARFNEDIAWEPLYPKIAPVLGLPLRFHFNDFLLLYMEPSVSSDPEHYGSADRFGTNVPLGLSRKLDLGFPLRAFLTAGGSWWNFQIGRDRLSYGTGHTGNLAISDNVDYQEFMRISLFSDFIKYTMLVSQMPLDLSISATSENIYPEYDPAGGYLGRTMHRYYYLHRLDFTIYDKVSIAVMEGIMSGDSPIELRFLNPMMIFHSFFSWWNYNPWRIEDNYEHSMIGSILSLELNWNILKSFSAYAQFIMNDFATSHEKGIEKKQPPNGLGYMAGLRYTHSFESWGSLFFLEFAYTDPYLHTLSSPFASFFHMRYLAWVQGRKQFRYIGYPRDVISLTLGTRFFKDDYLSLTGSLSWISTGSHYNLIWDWTRGDYAATPSGTANNKYMATLGVNWKPVSYLSLNGSLTGIISLNNWNISGNSETGGQASISVKFSY
jgi:hypothetical protein